MFDVQKESPTTRHLILKAAVPMKTFGMELSDLEHTEARDLVQSWVSTVQSGVVIKSPGSPSSGLGILLLGEPGHGKTTMASVALQTLIRTMQIPGLFLDYPKFLRLEKESWENDEIKERISEIYGDAKHSLPLLVLDDLGKEHTTQTGWAENTFDAVLRSRFNAGLPTVITSNVPLKKWHSAYSASMQSFAHEAFIEVKVESDMGDRRL
jgi:DNA replication protein DnaC